VKHFKDKKPAFGKPGPLAIARHQAGGNLAAGMLLHQLKYYFGAGYKGSTLSRDGREWIAMSREQWARESGLSVGQMKNAALKHLRASPFVRIEQWKLKYTGPKLLWISLDVKALATAGLPTEMLPEKLVKDPSTHVTLAEVLAPYDPDADYDEENAPATLADVLAPIDPDAALKG
jgi:hypothetical protein